MITGRQRVIKPASQINMKHEKLAVILKCEEH